MTKECLIERTRALGFDQVWVAPPARCDRWAADNAVRPHRRWEKLRVDPAELLPGVKTVIVLLMGYRPYRAAAGQVTFSAYYEASHRARALTATLAEELRAAGVNALASPPLPHKAFAVSCGAARYGRNGLTASDALGSCQLIQLLPTDADFPVDDLPAPDAPFSDACASCDACLRACPAGVLSGDGLVDPERCLRAMDGDEPMPEWARPLIGGSLLGCDICQQVCARNGNVPEIDLPEPLRAALDLPLWLAGNTAKFAALVGDNLARKKRMQARACLVAANLRRRDCLPLIEQLVDDDYFSLREHARWAVMQLR